MTRVDLFVDLASPYAYLAASRAGSVMPVPVRLRPVLLGGIFRALGRGSWALTEAREAGMREIAARAAAYGLPPVVWPDTFPDDALLAMRAATAAEAEGFLPEFARHAYALHFAEGRQLSDPATLEAAAVRCGRDGRALLDAAVAPETKAALRAVTDAALAEGVTGVPTVAVRVGGGPPALFWGDDRLGDAARAAAAGA